MEEEKEYEVIVMDDKQRMQIIADNITYYRKEKKITQKELAAAIGISPSTLTDYIKLRSAPSFGVIQKMADYFGIKKSDIDTTFKEIKPTPAPQSPTDELTEAITGKVVQLDTPRKKVVLEVATEQLEEQQALEQAALQAQLLPETTVNEKVVPISDYVARETKPVPGEASAGTGVWAQDADHEHSFRVDDIPDDADYDTIAKVKGNSMLPIMADGDYLFIKLTSSVDANTIGIFQVDGENYVKKLRYTQDYRFYLESLNPDFDDIYFHEDSDIRTIGEIVDIYREG